MKEFMCTKEAALEIGVSERYARALALMANIDVPRMGLSEGRQYMVWNPMIVKKCKEIVDAKRRMK